MILERDGERVKKTLRVGAVPARVPDRPQTPLWLVVYQLSDCSATVSSARV